MSEGQTNSRLRRYGPLLWNEPQQWPVWVAVYSHGCGYPWSFNPVSTSLAGKGVLYVIKITPKTKGAT